MWSPTARRLSLILLLGVGPAATACGGGPPPPGRVYVVDRPPRPPVEVRGAVPGPGWVWIPGRYQWQPNGFLWQVRTLGSGTARQAALGARALEPRPARLVLGGGPLALA